MLFAGIASGGAGASSSKSDSDSDSSAASSSSSSYVVDVDLVVDLVGQRLLEFGLRVEFARRRAPDEAHEPAPFSGARANVCSQLS